MRGPGYGLTCRQVKKGEVFTLEDFHLPNFEPDTAIVMIRTTSPATILSSTEGAYFILDYYG